ncbi:methyltransferase domain-containing protein [Paenibacillus lycopersici]|uniref:Methyltransferase domain-containing protein n=1 Tax=Paenibacillus lycopersici TaxID=2704462 RepID=A0A6C0G6X5_9BACL|nr:methyltransferase domain-containing protein [Paenibacillus lycopersici]QHT62155.1 methyltransferase domain-containing protein [Paenibacillus lycopersici]
MQRVDLGCGVNKHRDCIGVDISASVNPDIVHDLNDKLPLEDDAVSFLLASRSLEYASDLHGVMREIYRVCKHKAIVCIVAPHAQAAIHIANPSIRSSFNEYTPYYLTPKKYHQEIVAAAQFSPEFIPREPIEVDFRLLRMEFFYFPLYLSPLYEPSERMSLMEVQMNMVDEILYHFVVVKQPITKEECRRLAAGRLEEPERIKERRLHDGMLTRQSAGNVIESAPDAQDDAEEKTAAEADEAARNKRKGTAGGSRAKTRPAAKQDGKAKPDAKPEPRARAKPAASKANKTMQIKMVEPKPELVRLPSRLVFMYSED